MKIAKWEVLSDNGFSGTEEFARVEADVMTGIRAVVWPEGASDFTINPIKNGNGVTPIKDAFIAYLSSQGWIPEYNRFDAHLTFATGRSLPFAVEWETGNISSSHRAINRMALGMIEGRISGGILVLPTRVLYPYLTDRVGNVEELRPYYPLWRMWGLFEEIGYLAIVGVEHDKLSGLAPQIVKGTDGRALL